MKSTEKIKNTRNIGLDALRGLGIFYIVGLFHLFDYTDFLPDYKNFITYGIASIVLGSLVLISGYFSGKSAAKYSSFKRVHTFYQKKILRIYPLFLLALFLFHLTDISGKAKLIKASFLFSIFQNSSPRTLWFIPMIMMFYLLTPFLILLSKNAIKYWLGCASLFGLLLCYQYFSNGMLDIRLALYLPTFTLGVYMSTPDPIATTIWSLKTEKILYFLFPIIFLISANSPSLHELEFLDSIFTIGVKVLEISVGALLLFKVFPKISPIFEQNEKIKNVLMFLSYSSFSMYLFHRPIFKVFNLIYFPNSEFNQFLYLFFGVVPAIMIISFLIQKGYDLTLQFIDNTIAQRRMAIQDLGES